MPLESIDELEDGETYHFIPDDEIDVEDSDRKYEFSVDLGAMDDDDFAGYGEGAIQMQYRDGYVSDVPVSNVKRYIERGAIAEGPING